MSEFNAIPETVQQEVSVDTPKKPKQPSQTDKLIKHVQASGVRLVMDRDTEETFALIPGEGNYPVKSTRFRRWLLRSSGIRANDKAIKDTVIHLDAAYGDIVQTHKRVARLGDTIYIALGGSTAVAIDSSGWCIADNPPVVFQAKKDMGTLPRPIRDGSMEDLKEFVNAGEDFGLFLVFLLDALKGRSPYTILMVSGEEGSAKSKLTEFSRNIIDPANIAKHTSLPKDTETLAVLASNRHLLAFDNVSRIEPWQSDALCRVATGSGLIKRSLYTNAEEQIFGGSNPVLMNGIPELGDKADFLGRVIKLTLQPIAASARKEERELWAKFQERLPFILGALYDLIVNGLKNETSVKAIDPPRMADTYRWLLACQEGTSWNFAERFKENVSENVKGVALDTPLGRAVREFMKDQMNDGFIWSGTPAKLHNLLRPYWDVAVGHDPANGICNYGEARHYPANARWLTGRIREISSSLRSNGIKVDQMRENNLDRTRNVMIEAKEHFSWTPPIPPAPKPAQVILSDAEFEAELRKIGQ